MEAYLKATGADKFASAFKNASAQVDGFKGHVDKASSGVKGFLKAAGILYVAKKGFDMVRDSVAGATKRIDTFEQFERVMKAVTGSTSETNKALDKTNAIVTGTGYTLDGAAQAVQNFVTRGSTVDEATKYVEAWGDAVAFYGDGSQEQFANVTDALAKMKTKGTVGMDQLNRLFDAGIDAVGMYAQATGRNADEVQKALSNGSISADDFIGTVSSAMMEGTNGVIKIKGAAKDAGATWGSTFANMKTAVSRGVANIITSIDDMLTSNGLPDMRSMVASFGKKFESVLSGIASGIPAVINTLKGWYDAAKQYIGPVGDLWDKVKEKLNLFADIVSPIFDGMKGAFMDLYGSLSPIMSSIGGLFESLWPIIQKVGIIVGAVLLPAFGIIESVYAATISAIGPVIKAFIDFGSMIANVINAVVALFTGDFSGALDFWNQATEDSIAVVKGLWDGVVNFISTFVKTIIGFFKNLWDVLVGHSIVPDMVNAIIDWFKKMITAGPKMVASMVKGIIGFFGNLFTGAVDKVKSMASSVKNKFTDMKNATVNKAKALYTGAKEKFNSMKSAVGNAMSGAKNYVSSKWEQAKNATSSKVSSLANGAKNLFSGMKNSVSTFMSNTSSKIGSAWSSAKSKTASLVGSIKSSASSKFNDMKSAITSKMSDVKSTISDKWSDAVNKIKGTKLFDIGKNIIQGLANGIKDKVGAVTSAVKSVTSKITGKIKSILNIHSPSRVTMKLGEYTTLGLAKGITNKKKSAEKAAAEAAKATQKAFKIALDKADYKFKIGKIDSAKYISELRKVRSEYAKTPEQVRKVNLQIKKIEDQCAKDRKILAKQAETLRKKQFSSALKLIKDKASANKISNSEELKQLQTLAKKYKKNSNERLQIDKEIATVQKRLQKEQAEVIKARFDKEKTLIESKKKMNELSLADELKTYERYLVTYKKGSEQRKYWEEQVYDVKQRINDKLVSINDDYARKMQDVNQKLIDDEQKLRDEYQKTLDDRTKALYSFAGIFDEIQEKEAVSGQQLINNLKGQVDTFEDWSDNIKKLANRGIEKGLLEELQEMGPKAAAEIAALNGLTDKQLEQYVLLWQKKNEMAKRQAINELGDMRYEMDGQMEALRQEAEHQLDALKKEWLTNIHEIRTGTKNKFNPMKSDLKTIGEQSIKGMMNGMESMRGSLMAKARSLADAVKSTIQSAFDIHSPSRWMRDMIGKNMIKGWIKGVESMRHQTLLAANNMADWMSPGATKLSTSHLPNNGYNQQGGTFTQNLTINSTQPMSPSETARKNKQALRQWGMEF